METLGAPQTHLALKTMINEVDEDGDGRLSFREFLLVYRKARAGELQADSGLAKLAELTEVDVDKVGVNGAKEFFEAKIEEVNKKSKFESEIRQEQEERKRMEEEKAMRRQQFLQKAAMFHWFFFFRNSLYSVAGFFLYNILIQDRCKFYYV